MDKKVMQALVDEMQNKSVTVLTTDPLRTADVVLRLLAMTSVLSGDRDFLLLTLSSALTDFKAAVREEVLTEVGKANEALAAALKGEVK